MSQDQHEKLLKLAATKLSDFKIYSVKDIKLAFGARKKDKKEGTLFSHFLFIAEPPPPYNASPRTMKGPLCLILNKCSPTKELARTATMPVLSASSSQRKKPIKYVVCWRTAVRRGIDLRPKEGCKM